jgi:hypothetical protein
VQWLPTLRKKKNCRDTKCQHHTETLLSIGIATATVHDLSMSPITPRIKLTKKSTMKLYYYKLFIMLLAQCPCVAAGTRQWLININSTWSMDQYCTLHCNFNNQLKNIWSEGKQHRVEMQGKRLHTKTQIHRTLFWTPHKWDLRAVCCPSKKCLDDLHIWKLQIKWICIWCKESFGLTNIMKK